MTRHSPSTRQTVQQLLERVFAMDLRTEGAFTSAGMSFSELVVLYELVRASGGPAALEVGMANGTSSVVICDALRSRGGGRLISIDPFQTSEYAGSGMDHVRRAGLADCHSLVEEPNYLALPALVRQGGKFDFIFIDGWHSFDYVIVDTFFADLLLRDGGVLALHDTDSPAVFKAVRFFETHRAYERLSPSLAVALKPLRKRLARRVRNVLGGPVALRQADDRRKHWRTIAAYRKLRSEITPERLVRQF